MSCESSCWISTYWGKIGLQMHTITQTLLTLYFNLSTTCEIHMLSAVRQFTSLCTNPFPPSFMGNLENIFERKCPEILSYNDVSQNTKGTEQNISGQLWSLSAYTVMTTFLSNPWKEGTCREDRNRLSRICVASYTWSLHSTVQGSFSLFCCTLCVEAAQILLVFQGQLLCFSALLIC